MAEKPEIILVISEDTKSSTLYLQDKIKSLGIPYKIKHKKITKSSFDVKGSSYGSDPKSVVRYAIDEKNKFNKKQKIKKSYPFSKVFCVMDVDNHDTLEKAIQIIEKENKKTESKIIPIISNECFEVWYVLHFEYATRELNRERKKNKKTKKFIAKNNNLSKLIEKHLDIEKYNKADNIFQKLKDNGDENFAIKNAEKLNKHHLDINTKLEKEIYNYNPSTQVHRLIKEINRIGDKKEFFDFEKLTKLELADFNKLYSDIPFVNNMWKLLFEEYQTENNEKRIEFLKEIFKKPYNSSPYINSEKIRTFFNDNYNFEKK